MLSAIAGSTLTIATLAFSLTLNAITQASGQLPPRIFLNFMCDRANQFVLGYFVLVFAYCLIVLRTIRGGDELEFVPSLAVMTGLIFALCGILVLFFFFNHIADSLQITTTAVNCIDHLGEVVGQIARRQISTRVRTKDGIPPVIVIAPDFSSYVETAFDQIRVNGKANQAIFNDFWNHSRSSANAQRKFPATPLFSGRLI